MEAIIKGLGNSDGLNLEFRADTPSDKYEEIAKIKMKSLSGRRGVLYCKDNSKREKILHHLRKPIR